MGRLTERRELLRHARANGRTLISLSGDNHNTFAGRLYESFSDASSAPLGAEFSICGISSPSLFSAFAAGLDEDSPLRPLEKIKRVVEIQIARSVITGVPYKAALAEP